ncbi:MAG: tryptophan synthase subunit alpha [Bacillota bacterium]
MTDGKKVFAENRISRKFTDLKQKGEKGLITFVTAGDPDLETTARLVLGLEQAGADIIELGIPYSDPLADGPVIQQASLRALNNGTTLRKVVDLVKELRTKTQVPLILMTYYNPVLQYGLAGFVNDAAGAGVDGLIVPDLPMEEAGELAGLMEQEKLCLIPLIAPTSGRERIGRIVAGAAGFVYCVSLTGVTGIRETVPEQLQEFMATARASTDLPLAVGFGISNPNQAAAVAGSCDAVIVGSALVKTINDHAGSIDMLETISGYVRTMKEAVKGSGCTGRANSVTL